MLWSGLYPSQKHLGWLLCSGIIRDRLAAARAPLNAFSRSRLSCALRNSAFGLRVRVTSRHTYKYKKYVGELRELEEKLKVVI